MIDPTPGIPGTSWPRQTPLLPFQSTPPASSLAVKHPPPPPPPPRGGVGTAFTLSGGVASVGSMPGIHHRKDRPRPPGRSRPIRRVPKTETEEAAATFIRYYPNSADQKKTPGRRRHPTDHPGRRALPPRPRAMPNPRPLLPLVVIISRRRRRWPRTVIRRPAVVVVVVVVPIHVPR